MTPRHLASGLVAAGLLSASAARAAAPELTVSDAIRAAWAHDARLQASTAQATSAARGAEAADWALGPTVTLGAQGTLTSQPSHTFALLLDQGQITAADFDPARLNSPQAREASACPPSSSSRSSTRHSGQPAAAHTPTRSRRRPAGRRCSGRSRWTPCAPTSRCALPEALAYAEDALRTARDTETFVKARVAQDVLLASEASRSTAYRAQAEAERAAAIRQLAQAAPASSCSSARRRPQAAW